MNIQSMNNSVYINKTSTSKSYKTSNANFKSRVNCLVNEPYLVKNLLTPQKLQRKVADWVPDAINTTTLGTSIATFSTAMLNWIGSGINSAYIWLGLMTTACLAYINNAYVFPRLNEEHKDKSEKECFYKRDLSTQKVPNKFLLNIKKIISLNPLNFITYKQIKSKLDNIPGKDHNKFWDFIINNHRIIANPIKGVLLFNMIDASRPSKNEHPDFDNFMQFIKIYEKLDEQKDYPWAKDYLDNNYNIYKYMCLDEAGLRDENGKITDKNVDNLIQTYYSFVNLKEALACAKNKDGSFAWDMIDKYRELYTILVDGIQECRITSEDIPIEIMQYVTQESYDKNGDIDKNRFQNLKNDLSTEIKNSTIRYSRTLQSILPKELRYSLGLKKDLAYSTQYETSKLFRLYEQEAGSVLSFLVENTKYDYIPEQVFSFLYNLTSNDKTSKILVAEFSQNPRSSVYIKDTLIKMLGCGIEGEARFMSWFNDEDNGYKKAYSNYYNDLFNNSQDLLTLIKQSPNVAPWILRAKAKELNIEPVLGEIPEEFGTQQDFKELLKRLRAWHHKYQCAKDKTVLPKTITIGERTFKFEPFQNGLSAKNVYRIQVGDKNYIVKFTPNNVVVRDHNSQKILENQSMRADSPFLNSMIDFYLKENGCVNAADIKYFDYFAQASLYEMTEGQEYKSKGKEMRNLYNYRKLKEIADIADLGIELNDVNEGNFIYDKNGNNILIDSGHAQFDSCFRPMVVGKHISLQNLSGREI